MHRRMIGRIPLLVIGALVVSTPAMAAERRYSVTDYDRIIVEGPFVVRLVAGRPSAAVATGSQESLDRISIEVSGQTLRIRRNRNQWTGSATSGGQQGPVTIELGTRNLRSARLIGPASLEIDRVEGLRVELTVEGSGRLAAANVAADNLTLGLAGSGRIELAGQAGTMRADIQGSGDLDAPQLRAENLTLTSTSSGTIAIAAVRSATVNALGLGTIRIEGRAACTVRGPSAELVSCGVRRR